MIEIQQDTIGHFDDISTLHEANQVAIKQGMAIRVQPPAPRATEYFFVENGEWKRQLCGHDIASTVPAEKVRTAVQNAVDSQNAKAVNKSNVKKYA